MRSAWAVILCLCASAVTAFEEGNYLPIARRSQYQAVRTPWHDLLSRHCPRFDLPAVVAVPLPAPKLVHEDLALGSYKLQFSLHGDRLFTSWLKILGKGAPGVPLVKMHLTSRGAEVTAVRAEAVAVPEQYLATHHVLLEDFSNATRWPKHLLIQYTWDQLEPMHAQAGLYVLFLTGVLTLGGLTLNVLITYQKMVKAFVTELTGDQPQQVKAD